MTIQILWLYSGAQQARSSACATPQHKCAHGATRTAHADPCAELSSKLTTGHRMPASSRHAHVHKGSTRLHQLPVCGQAQQHHSKPTHPARQATPSARSFWLAKRCTEHQGCLSNISAQQHHQLRWLLAQLPGSLHQLFYAANIHTECTPLQPCLRVLTISLTPWWPHTGLMIRSKFTTNHPKVCFCNWQHKLHKVCSACNALHAPT